MNSWPKQSQMVAHYGNPARADGKADPKWEADNLITIKPPYEMFYDGKPVRSIRVHRLIADSLLRILTKIGTDISAADRKKYGLDQFGGVHNFRIKRSGQTLSTHAFASAIDLAPALNPFKVKYGARPNMMPMQVVKLFEAEGWVWGGLWANGDAMHFQAARIG